MKPPSVVVITGAGSGVGRATARAFASMGVAVGLIARGEDSLEAAAKEVSSAGGRALAISADVADAAAVERAAARVEEELGPLDVWVNNAMTSVLAPFAEVSPEEFRRVTEVTYLGQVYGTRAALARMLPRDHGAIVCVGSALAYRGIPLQSAYCGAKHAIQGFTESVRCELRHGGSHVRITMVQLPALNTPQFEVVLSRLPRRAQPVPPIYQPEVAARAIHHAAHHYRREWNVGLVTDVVLAGNAVAPGFGDYYLGKTGYDSQMTEEPEEPGRPDDLYEPLPGDRGAHGRFDDRASESSQQWWVTRNRGWLALGGLALAGLALLRTSGGRTRRGLAPPAGQPTRQKVREVIRGP